ncbi:exopolysaccharide biosynthesis protein [Mangrovicoccus sp. HB161399]|uniref:exopolysaccharide biosynthesis protein n=1 Tax=Mangrovicoccus sp. HB161399 TaxID=2720392 RepID=UPI0020A63B42|nr:exopolysaccharide biosynthesis protein [Mangrovicoccus sp. HB161399]
MTMDADEYMEFGQDGPMEGLVAKLGEAAAGEKVSLQGILHVVGDTSFLPVLMVPALLVVSPLSGIPLFSSICGLTIAFVAVQMVFGRRHLWLPEAVTRKTVSGPRARRAIGRLGGLARWLDRHATGHGSWAMRRPIRKACEIACLTCGLAMPFLELVPFSSSVLGLSVLLFAVAMLARDALFMAMGALLMATALSLPFYAISAVAAAAL